jgi:hypothetical protein
MSTRLAPQNIKDAVIAVSEAIDYLDAAKKKLIELHVATEEVDNSEFLVENHHRWASPDADTHDVLFARLEKARNALTAYYNGNEVGLILKQLEATQEIINRAKDLSR